MTDHNGAGRNSSARGRRMADKARGPRPPRVEAPRDEAADIGVEARLAAGILLNAALEGRGGLDSALTFREVSSLEGPDRAFARAVAMAALRRLGEIDQILDRRLQKAPPLAVRTTSLTRPSTMRSPSSSMRPASPVCSQPSTMALAVPSGSSK